MQIITKKMSKINNVYITSTGKKYHFYLSCTYIKDKNYKIIPLNKALDRRKGPCSLCKNLYEKNGGKIDDELIYMEQDEIKEDKNIKNIKNKYLNNDINIININNSKNTSNLMK